MTTNKRRLSLLAATAGVLALGLSACAADDGDNGNGNGNESGGESSAASNTLEQLQEDGTITLAIADERPYSWIEDGEPTGATIAIHEEIFSNLGIDNIEVVEVDWNSLIPGLNAGRFDAISAGMSILPDRCAQAAFSDPEIMYTTALVVETGNPQDLSDLDSVLAKDGDVTLAVQGGAIEADYAEQLGIKNTIQVDNTTAGIEVVQNGRADAFAITAISLNWMTKDMDDVETTEAFVQVLDGVEQEGAGATVFRQDDTELLEAYNEELANIKGDDAKYLELVEEFGFTAENNPPESLTTEQLCAGDLG